MPVTVVVGGQFGSEGKGKVAHHLAATQRARAVVRVGGSNSGHTSVDAQGRAIVLRQLPTAALLGYTICVLGPGSYIDPEILLDEVETTRLDPERLYIDPNAITITRDDRAEESSGPLGPRIASTCSGTGAAVRRRIARRTPEDLAGASRALAPFVRPSTPLLRELVSAGERVVVEGTQGFGLSLLHSPHFPHVTSRDTTAAAALAESGLSPRDVDELVLVLRAHPIRVAGNSGPFGSEEISWETVAREGGHDRPLAEFTSVTKRLRRIARFDPHLVRAAIAVNHPSMIVLNHVDYVDAKARNGLTPRASEFVAMTAESIGRRIDLVGLGPATLVSAAAALAARPDA